MNPSISLVTGGARSGKSRFAEGLFKSEEVILYVATAKAIDDEMKERISMHQQQRPAHWRTLECYQDFQNSLASIPPEISGILVDCVTLMVTNILMEADNDWDNLSKERAQALEANIMSQVNQLLQGLKRHGLKTVIVTNEVGLGLVPEYPLGRLFRDIAGRVNQYLAAESQEVYFVICGIPHKIK